MPIPDALLILNGGTYYSIESAQVTVSDFNGLFAPVSRGGENIKIPYRHGEIGVAGTYEAYDFEIPLVVTGLVGTTMASRRAHMIGGLSNLAELVKNGVFVMRRRIVSGDGTYWEDEANGQYKTGLNAERLNADNGRCVLTFRNLDGYWHRVGGDGGPVLP